MRCRDCGDAARHANGGSSCRGRTCGASNRHAYRRDVRLHFAHSYGDSIQLNVDHIFGTVVLVRFGSRYRNRVTSIR